MITPPPPTRLLKNSVPVNPDRDSKPLDLIWPRNQREEDIIKQQNDLHNHFHWYECSIGFIVATSLWSICAHLWGG